MSSQKIPGVGRIDTGKVTDYTETKTGILGRDINGNVIFHFSCASEYYERVTDALYASRFRNAPQIDWSFLKGSKDKSE